MLLYEFNHIQTVQLIVCYLCQFSGFLSRACVCMIKFKHPNKDKNFCSSVEKSSSLSLFYRNGLRYERNINKCEKNKQKQLARQKHKKRREVIKENLLGKI